MTKSATLNASRSCISNRKACKYLIKRRAEYDRDIKCPRDKWKAMTPDQKKVFNAKRRQYGREKGI